MAKEKNTLPLWKALGFAAFLAFCQESPAYAVTAVDVVKTVSKFALWGALVFIYVISFIGVAMGLKDLLLSGGQYGESRGGWKKLLLGGLGIMIPTLLILFKMYVLKGGSADVMPDFINSGPDSLSNY